jgi:PAS domain S-box-containing protein
VLDLAEALVANGEEIRQRSNLTLRGDPDFADTLPLSDRGIDLLATLVELLREDGAGVDEASIPFADTIALRDYSLGHFYAEVRALKAAAMAVLGEAQPVLLLDAACRALDDLFAVCLRGALIWGELAFEQSLIGYCSVDQEGNILRINRALTTLLDRNDVVGTPLILLFSEEERPLVAAVLPEAGSSETLLRRTKLRGRAGDVPVILEVGPITVPGRRAYAHASFIDITRVVEAERRTVDSSPWPMLRVDANFAIDHANRSALRLLGLPIESVLGRRLLDLLTNTEDRCTMEAQYMLRRSGQVGQYELRYRRPQDQRLIPIAVDAWPEYDNLGQVSGACGFLTDQTFEKAYARIADSLINLSNDVSASYGELLATLKEALGVDMATVGAYATDKNVTYWRALARVPADQVADSKRWWRVSPGFAAWVAAPDPREKIISDYPEWAEQDPLLRDDPVVAAMVEAGYRSLLIYPVRLGRTTVAATISLWKKQANYFSQSDFDLIGRLRAEKVVGVGLYSMERKKETFLFDVVSKMAALEKTTHDTAKLGAQTIAECLQSFYDWQHVGIFKVTPKSFVLLGQASGPSGFALPPGYVQNISEGVLGRAYEQRQPQLHGDISHLAEYVGPPGRQQQMRSELCFPVVIEDELVWLINLEDPTNDAFCNVDIDSLQRVVTGVSPFLALLFTKLALVEVLRVASDGIILGDAEGRVRSLNPSAASMLKLSQQSAVGRRLQDFVSRNDPSYDLFRGEWSGVVSLALRTIDLIDSEGMVLKVRLSICDLPDGSGRFVAFLQDLRQVERLEELEALTGALREIAMQTRLPLALARAGMETLSTAADAAIAERAHTALRQLAKADETFERIVLYGEAAERLSPFFDRVSLDRLVRELCADFTLAERAAVDVVDLGQLPPVSGDAYQLGFSLRSLLNYLLRIRPPEGRVIVRGRVEDDCVVITCEGSGIHAVAGPGDQADPGLRARAEVGLGGEVLKRFIEKTHGGSFDGPEPVGGGRIGFRIRLPINGDGRLADDTRNPEKRPISGEETR